MLVTCGTHGKGYWRAGRESILKAGRAFCTCRTAEPIGVRAASHVEHVPLDSDVKAIS